MKIEWKQCFKVGISVFILFLCIHYWSAVGNLIGVFFSGITPILIGCALAYLVNIFMCGMEKRYFPNTTNSKLIKSKRPVCMIGAILLVIGVFFLLIMLEPDFGTAMVIVLTLTSILFISGVKLSFFVKIGIVGLLGIVGLIVVAPYRMLRIVSFLNPWVDPLGSGYQIIQSLYAIGPGGLLGQGFLNSRQKQFYLPEPQTDFIFSIISEEFGFLGILIVTAFFGFIFYRIVKIALNCDNLFYKYLSFGLGFGIIIQALLNICVVIGLIPVTGVTLPFFSYGGSSLLVSMISIGIILSISKK